MGIVAIGSFFAIGIPLEELDRAKSNLETTQASLEQKTNDLETTKSSMTQTTGELETTKASLAETRIHGELHRPAGGDKFQSRRRYFSRTANLA